MHHKTNENPRMISVNALTVEFAAKPLFDNINYVINDRDRIALVGRNGAGKSTMLKIIAGLQHPTAGTVAIPNGTTIGYLPQHMTTEDSVTVVEEVRKVFSHIDEMNARLDSLNSELAERTDYDSREYHDLIDRVSNLSDCIAMAGSVASIEAEMEKTLLGLGFERKDFNRPTSEFSGGWRMRIELAKILLQRPDVLLLDEPTNHLDIESIQWLENFLRTKARAVVLVSHDRAFIDNVTSRTIEISLGKIYDYAVNYSKYVVLRQERVEQQMRAYQNQQKQIADTEAFIERFRYKATKAVQVQSRMKQLAKIERIEVDEIDSRHINLRFPPAPRSGDFPIIAENVGKAYGEHQVFDNATFTLRRGDKVAFVGKNGEGKSTFVKAIMGEISFTGDLKLGHNVQIGYFAQNQASLLDGNLSVFDTVDRVAVGDIRTRLKDILGAFMFGGEESEKPVRVLSGGERTRLAMIRLLLQPVNLLILDEPTNHLDMATKDVLKQAIREFNGTIILVSHDREFLDGLVDKVYHFSGGKVTEYLGGIYDFLESHKVNTIDQLVSRPETESKQKAKSENINQKQENEPRRLSYAEQREREKLLRKARKRVEEAEAAVGEREAELAAVEQLLSTTEGASDPANYTRHAELQRELENAMSVWELASLELDEMEKKL